MGPHRLQLRSYGNWRRRVQRFAFLAITIACALVPPVARAADAPVKIVVLGDSLSAGYGLPKQEAFPEKLGAALKAKGIPATVVNAGVSGDTSTGGLGRLDWSVPHDTDAVILELGANDALRGIDPKLTEKNLDAILRRLQERRIAVLLVGMRAPPNMGPDFVHAFDGIFPRLAEVHQAIFYPFFLDGVAANSSLNLSDGMHPNAAGVGAIVRKILPKVEELISRVRTARGS